MAATPSITACAGRPDCGRAVTDVAEAVERARAGLRVDAGRAAPWIFPGRVSGRGAVAGEPPWWLWRPAADHPILARLMAE
ncbi:hypothetical protein [Streptomyces californicus]|uniref:hypothetical protein n=1 Tax=Streptomyces californicus TaxID=67351 RepID=UPI0037BD6AA9